MLFYWNMASCFVVLSSFCPHPPLSHLFHQVENEIVAPLHPSPVPVENETFKCADSYSFWVVN